MDRRLAARPRPQGVALTRAAPAPPAGAGLCGTALAARHQNGPCKNIFFPDPDHLRTTKLISPFVKENIGILLFFLGENPSAQQPRARQPRGDDRVLPFFPPFFPNLKVAVSSLRRSLLTQRLPLSLHPLKPWGPPEFASHIKLYIF